MKIIKPYMFLLNFTLLMTPILSYAGGIPEGCVVYYSPPYGDAGPTGVITYLPVTTMLNNCIAITKSQSFYASATDWDYEVCTTIGTTTSIFD